jgi:hypothetical protein
MEDLSDPISWLSQPGGAFYFKRTQKLKLEGAIENLRFSPIWNDGKLVEPTVPEPIYLGEIRVFIERDVLNKKGIEYWMSFIEGICKATRTKTAVLQLKNETSDVQITEGKIAIAESVKNIFS